MKELHYTVIITRNTSGTWGIDIINDKGELLYDPLMPTLSSVTNEVRRSIALDLKGN